MIITVAKFDDKSTEKGAWYKVTDEKGKDHHIFSSKVSDLLSKKPLLNVGMTCELVKVKTDKGWDTVDIKASTASQAVAKEQSGDFATFHMRQNSIEKQCSLKCAVEYCAGQPIADVLHNADYFYQWLTEGIIPQVTLTTEPAKPSEPTEAFEALPSVTKPEETFDLKTVASFEKERVKQCERLGWNDAEFDAWLMKHKGEYTTIKLKAMNLTERDYLIAQLKKIGL